MKRLSFPFSMKRLPSFFFSPLFLSFSIALLAALTLARTAVAQSAPAHTLYGDFKVDESHAPGSAPKMFNVILKGSFGNTVARQTVSDNGRFIFPRVGNGEYDIVVELESTEVARVHVTLNQSISTDIRQDISLEWRGTPGARLPKPGTIAADTYARSSANQSLLEKALDAAKKKSYAQSIALLRQVVESDPKDYEAWTELGTQQFNDGANDDAEKSFARAAEERPTFLLPYLNLGKLRLARKDYDGAVEALTKAVALTPPSADANYQLGEAYLQLKRGSKAVPYFTEAIRLGKTEGHLRLAALYNAAGLRDRAAAEYEQFLLKNPDYPERKKLEAYIKENKKK
jgi:cytochrome c-type biogenesis protein CcmH/NrfG